MLRVRKAIFLLARAGRPRRGHRTKCLLQPQWLRLVSILSL